MKTLHDPALAAEVKARLARLRPDSPRQWGKMDVAQMVSHCAGSLATAVGDERPGRMLIGRVVGGMVKRVAVGNDTPIKRNSPTSPDLRRADRRELDAERARLVALIDRFVAAGPAGCTTHPHTFFGRLTPDEWGNLMYKHLDHHLRQFGA